MTKETKQFTRQFQGAQVWRLRHSGRCTIQEDCASTRCWRQQREAWKKASCLKGWAGVFCQRAAGNDDREAEVKRGLHAQDRGGLAAKKRFF